MNGGRPRALIGSYGTISVTRRGTSYVALARIRDADGRLRRVTDAARTESAARARQKERLLDRPGFGTGGLLDLSSSLLNESIAREQRIGSALEAALAVEESRFADLEVASDRMGDN